MTYNAGERRDVKLAEKASRRAERDRLEVITNLMSTPPGRAYTLDFLERTHVFASSFTPNALTMAFSEGERNVGLQLLNDIMRACPSEYIEMMEERNARDITADTTRRRNGSDDADRIIATGDDADPLRYFSGQREDPTDA